MDEATSALDGESAGLIRTSLRAAARGNGEIETGSIGTGVDGRLTVLAITHATEIMKWADKVVVVEEGRVEEEGEFEALIKNKGGLWRVLHSDS